MSKIAVNIQDKQNTLILPRGTKLDLTNNPQLACFLIEPSFPSKDPIIIIATPAEGDGVVLLQTGLSDWLEASLNMTEAARTHWGWVRPTDLSGGRGLSVDTRRSVATALKAKIDEWAEKG